MPAVSTYGATGTATVDALLIGVKWAVNAFTFSFPTSAAYYGSNYGYGEPSNNFEAANAAQQDAVRAALQMYAAVANVSFTEIAETSTKHADLRYAESDAPGTAWAYYPTTNAAGGDTWFNNSKNWYDNPDVGNYAGLTVIHETGHAMGLKHAHESSGQFGAMPSQYDSLEYTVMSYRSYVGQSTSGGYTNGSTSYPQTLMMMDIAALQTLYGANYGTNSGDTVYSWSASTGEQFVNGAGQGGPAGNKIFMTVWDGGGVDTYDFSNYTANLTIDLRPGGWSTTTSTQLASLGNGHTAAGNIANALLFNNNPASLIENAVGGTGSDTIVGNAANNRIAGGRGNDAIDGGGGTNTAVYSGQMTDYLITDLLGAWTVADLRLVNSDGVDTLANIQFLQFSDTLFALGDDPPIVDDPPTPLANDPPVAVDDSYWVQPKKTLAVKANVGVLANDSDPDGDALSAVLVSGAQNGKLTLADDGSFTFKPNRKFQGTTSFQYRAGDGDDLSDVSTVTIVVSRNQPSFEQPDDPDEPGGNATPLAVDDGYALKPGKKLKIKAKDGVLVNDSDPDGDALKAILVSGPDHGSLSLKDNGAFTYKADKTFTGTTSFQYAVTDGQSTSAVATVTFDVSSSGRVALDDPSHDQMRPAAADGAQIADSFVFDSPPGGTAQPLDFAAQGLEGTAVAADGVVLAPLGLELLLTNLEANFGAADDGPAGEEPSPDPLGLPDFLAVFYSEFTLSA